jgi:hypothetical protein
MIAQRRGGDGKTTRRQARVEASRRREVEERRSRGVEKRRSGDGATVSCRACRGISFFACRNITRFLALDKLGMTDERGDERIEQWVACPSAPPGAQDAGLTPITRLKPAVNEWTIDGFFQINAMLMPIANDVRVVIQPASAGLSASARRLERRAKRTRRRGHAPPRRRPRLPDSAVRRIPPLVSFR